MKRLFGKSILLALMMACVLSLSAQGTLLSGAQRTAVMQKIVSKTSNVSSLKCDFTQSKSSSMLSTVAKSEGKMNYVSPDVLRWEYVSPYQYAIVIKGDSTYAVKDGQRQTQKDSRMMRGIASLVINSVSGTRMFDEKNFKIDVYEGNGTYSVLLQPLRKDMKRAMKSIKLQFDKSNCHVKTIDIMENDNSLTAIKFKNVIVK